MVTRTAPSLRALLTGVFSEEMPGHVLDEITHAIGNTTVGPSLRACLQ